MEKTSCKTTQQRKVEDGNKHSPSNSPTQSEEDSEYSTSLFTLFDPNASQQENKRRSKRTQPEALGVIQTVNKRFCNAIDHSSFRLENRSVEYDHTVSKNVSKMSKRMTVQIKSHIFDHLDRISIIGFLCNFKSACDTNGVHEGAAISHSNFFMKKLVLSELNTRLSSKRRAETVMPSVEKTTKLTTYSQVYNYLLPTNATDKK